MSESVADQQDERILILDFGSQVTQLIARRVRESGVYSEVWPYNNAPEDRIRAYAPSGIILSGGPASVPDANSPRAPDVVFTLGVPVLGICYGQMLMCEQLGGQVGSSGHQGIRPSLRGHHRRMRPVPRRLGAGRPRTGLDEPRRPHNLPPTRLLHSSGKRRRPLRSNRRRTPPFLRPDVPPRGRPHPPRRPTPQKTSPTTPAAAPAPGPWPASAPRKSPESARK